MKSKYIMIQGTSSSAGKSVLTAGFLRYFANRGVNCSPFKSQNMSLNSFITEDGSEIAVSQAVQSQAAFKKPLRQINPILIKPSSDTEMHLVLDGKHFGNMNFEEYNAKKSFFLKKASQSFDFLTERNELVIAEGAGSPAEINLYKYDIANMGFAEIYNMPVILIADIERGGVFASLYGTVKLLKPKWRKLVKGFIINKFRGNLSILKPGIDEIEKSLNIPCAGVIPYIKNIHIEAEDSLNLKNDLSGSDIYSDNGGKIKIGIVRLEHISNFNEFDPLFFDERFHPVFFDAVPIGEAGEFDIIIIPGTKTTASDLNQIKKSGIFDYIKRFEKFKKGIILGICGGFQMMGNIIKDPYKLESRKNSENLETVGGFGFFGLETILSDKKITVSGKYDFNGSFLDGYEIHNGRSFLKDAENVKFDRHQGGKGISSFLLKQVNDNSDGKCALEFSDKNEVLSLISIDGRKIGTYVHGLFADKIFRDFLEELVNKNNKNKNYKYILPNNNNRDYADVRNESFNILADNIEKYVDMKLFKEITRI
ncbi:MAG: cobyric acid synthase [Candidatus Acidulodesulfobacterium acidiphilum]|jgi:cobyric acid synthase CobQ|uniref:Cobyric acid synthase n=1 Tax=Candidatus Acidulodesulfobacterium acidiphilum TaxID=2597224 RepID=A0A520X9E6_9DELT|nr:MAG: cobyric acid synthase [Candidatus Acidulodesulfobacterium acidiphilum]